MDKHIPSGPKETGAQGWFHPFFRLGVALISKKKVDRRFVGQSERYKMMPILTANSQMIKMAWR
jgi:hypothetical protein